MDAKKLLQLIRSGKAGRDRAIKFLFLDELLKKKIRNMLFSKGGKEEHVHDILVNAILEFVKTVVRKPDLKTTTITLLEQVNSNGMQSCARMVKCPQTILMISLNQQQTSRLSQI